MYRLTFSIPEENLANAKARGYWPFPLYGRTWENGDSIEVESLEPYYFGEKRKKKVHEFFTVEELYEDTEATDRKD